MIKKIGIIGSGIAAAALAHALRDFADITVFEKARGVGGRLSTRYKDDFEFDLGAPFFCTNHPCFQSMTNALIHQGIVSKWSYQEVLTEHQTCLKSTYVGLARMNDLPKFLLKDIKVCLEHKVTEIKKSGNFWMLGFEKQASQTFDWVISTAPPAQSNVLLPKLFEYSDLLTEIEFLPSMVLMLGLSQPLNISWDCYTMPSDIIRHCIVNSNKPGRKNKQSLVIEATATFSKQYFDTDETSIISLLYYDLVNFLDLDSAQIEYQAVHKWRYASSTANKTLNMVLFDKALGLGVCGDWVEGGGVEAAFLSGVRMAQVLRQIILGSKI